MADLDDRIHATVAEILDVFDLDGYVSDRRRLEVFDAVARALEAAVDAERERCASIAEACADDPDAYALEIAECIRGRRRIRAGG